MDAKQLGRAVGSASCPQAKQAHHTLKLCYEDPVLSSGMTDS